MDDRMEAELAADAARRRTFAALQPKTTALLQLRTQPKALAAALQDLTAAILQQEAAGLEGCLEYALLPLLFLVDSLIVTRTKAAGGDAPAAHEPPFPAAKSDAVAEAALTGLAALLNAAAPQVADDFVPLLERLVRVAALPRAAASEEVRVGGLRALAAALQGIRGRAPAAALALQQEDNAPLVGHAASVLLQAADAEIEAGATGSASLRAAALGALRLLIVAVDNGDVLAFFVPGLASGLGKAIAAAGAAHGEHVRSGPAAGSTAAAEAVGALAAVLRATLGDATARRLLAARKQTPGASTAGDALAALQSLALPAASSQDVPSGPLPPPRRRPMPDAPKFRVQRNVAWLRETAERVGDILVASLPPLQNHPHAAVRTAVTQGAADLLDACSAALPAKAATTLLDCLLSAAQDEWSSVARPACEWLAARAAGAAASGASHAVGLGLTWPVIESAIVSLVDGLPAAARRGDAALTLHARRLTTALQAAPPATVASAVLANPARRTALASAFCEALEFDRAAAPLLLHAGVSDAGPRTIQAVSSEAAGLGSSAGLTAGGAVPTAATASAAAAEPAADCSGSGAMPSEDGSAQSSAQPLQQAAAAALPRMPMGLAYIGSRRAYGALATAMRTAARLAVTAGAGAPELLRGVLEELLQRLHSGLERGSAISGGWQEGCAAAAVVASEVLYGASPTWRDPSCLLASDASAAAAGAGSGAAAVAQLSAAPELVRCAGMLLEALSDERLCGLPTHSEAAATAALPSTPAAAPGRASGGSGTKLAAAQRWTPQVLGENAMLVRVVLEGFGAAAVALGPALTQPGTLLRLVLLPTLERIGDPCAPVAAAADAAIACMCAHCGYPGGLGQLISENADYVVDGVCARLRAMGANSRAPQLLAAVLGRGGCPAGLLPLLGEPAAAALRGLSITARRAHPAAAAPFLQALTAMCGGAAGDAAEVAAAYRRLAAIADTRLQEVQAAAVAAAPAGSTHIEEEQGKMSPTDEDAPGDDATIEEIQEYFLRRTQKQQQEASLPEKAPLSAAEWEELDSLARRMSASAKIAGAAADVAAPLLLSLDLKVALLAANAALAAFCVLADTSAAADVDAEVREAVEPRATAEAPRPDPPRLLPAVHVLWAPLMSALRDSRAALAERAAGVTAEVTAVAGARFLATRWRAEAWPPLRQMLVGRPMPRPSPALAPDERAAAPGAAQRLRLAALRSIADTAAASAAADVLQVVAFDVAEAAAACLADSHPPAVRGAASEALLALAAVDSDAVWLVLTSVAAAAPGSAAAPAPPGPAFSPFEQVLPPWQQSKSAPGAAAASGAGPRAAALLQRLPGGAAWHARAKVDEADECD